MTYVGTDLSRGDLAAALHRSGFEQDQPAIFLAEGLTMYLDRATNDGLFRSVATVATGGSRLAVDFAEGGGSISLPSQVVWSAVRLSWQLSGEQRDDWANEPTARELLRVAGLEATEASNGVVLAERYLGETPIHTEGTSPLAFCVLAMRRRPEEG